jgi:N-terminal half of MaoC dehydratase
LSSASNRSDIKASIGMRSECQKFLVTEDRIRQFCEVIGTPYTGIAPPTFHTIFRDGEFHILANLGLSLSRLLHADQEYYYKGKISPGDQIEYDTTLTKAIEKKGENGSTYFLVYETEVRRVLDGVAPEILATSKTTIISR